MTTEPDRSDLSKLPRLSQTPPPPPPEVEPPKEGEPPKQVPPTVDLPRMSEAPDPRPWDRREGSDGDADGAARRARGRVGIIVVLIISIALAGVTSSWARRLRTGGADVAGGGTSATSLASMNSFALALLLGGLRGPLVMFLWTNSENLKNEKNLEDFDTYVEWIRLLQPEFDTVHIFQVWNKAYNISVQMAAVQNKYTTILDALEYAKRVEAQRPNNVSMIYQIGSIFYDKLGGSQEKDYYRKRVREESKPHKRKQGLARTDPGWRPLELEPVLDEKGMILPHLLEPKYQRPATLPASANGQWVNGAELQFLEPYQPFPYGVSALAFGYNYHRQAQLLQAISGQVHANLSQPVVDSRPGLALKGWSEDEWERARRLELAALNQPVPAGERGALELPTANVAPTAPISSEHRAAVDEAVFSYDLAARLSRDAYEDYTRHVREYAQNFHTYQSHMDSMLAQEPLLAADRDYLKAMAAGQGEERKKLLDAAAKNYREAVKRNIGIIFRYYVPDVVAQQVLPQGVTRADVDKKDLTHEQVLTAYVNAMNGIARQPHDPDQEDRGEYQRYVDRAMLRLKAMGQ